MRSICPLCEATCGIEVFMEDGLPESVRGDDADLFSQGYICPKGVALVELSEDPDRLREPMIREGDDWKIVSWEEAFARIDAGWKKLWEAHGKESLGVYMGNPVSHSTSMSLYGTGLVKMLGTPNFFTASTVDQIPKHASSGYLFGHPLSIPIPDIDRSDYLLILGANPLESNGSLMTAPNLPGRLKALQKRSGTLVVIDPRKTKTAKLADRYHPIRPGTDALFLAAIVHQLFAENRVVADGAIALCEGVSAIREAVQPFSPERVAPHCDMASEAIVQITRELSDAPSAAIHARIGTCTQAHGTINSWLVDVIHLLTGNLDRAGGAMFTKAAHGPDNTKGVDGIGRGFVTGRRKSRVSGHPEVMGEFPCAAMAEEITTPGPGQIRGMLTMGGNPVLSTPDGARLDKALASLDFMVSFDVYLNETTRHAHVILPDVGPFERVHYDLSFSQLAIHNYARYAPPLMDPFARPKDWEVLLQLVGIAAGMGPKANLDLLDEQGVRQAIGREQRRKNTRIGDMDADAILETLAPRRGPERLLDFLLRTGPYGDAFGKNDEGITLAALEAAPEGIDLGPLQSRLPEVLRTASGKIELAPPCFVEELTALSTNLNNNSESKSILLIGRRQLRSNNSWMHNVPSLVRGKKRCTLLIHPDTAAEQGLKDGCTVTVSNGTGQLRVPLEFTTDIMPGIVSLPHGWGHGVENTAMGVAVDHAGVNMNLLMDATQLDRLSGNAVLSGVPVTVSVS